MANNKATGKEQEVAVPVAEQSKVPVAEQSKVPVATGEFEWRCLTCGKTALPTKGAYMGVIKHKCSGKKEIWLVDKGSGEKLSNQLQQAEGMGLLTGEEAPPKAKDKGKEVEASEITSEGIFAYTIHLPSDAFTMFNLAKFSGLEKDGEKPFDEWIWDCVLARFRYDYEMELILAPIPEEGKRRR
ncbi:hypothetical protein ES705_39965 [subsurface metagenome]